LSADSALIDRIVHGVLTQLAAGGALAVAKPQATIEAVAAIGASTDEVRVEISERIVTADVLSERVNGSRIVVVGPKALVTPAAWDLICARGLTLSRGDAQPPAKAATGPAKSEARTQSNLQPLLLVVRNTEAAERLWADLLGGWRRELLGCPDDAARLAISELTRGGASAVVILAEQTYRAACLANRNDAIKAVAVRDAADVRVVRKQLRANVWCVDPSGRSWFELRNLMKAINK